MAPARTVSERLADYVVGLRFDDLPDPVVSKAKDHLVHLLGVALRGRDSEEGSRAVRLAHELSGGAGDCSIVGERQRVNAMDAVFANSLLMGYHNLDDFQLPSGFHPGVVTQPVAWALGERGRATGREVLAAVVVGYDVGAKLTNAGWSWGAESPRRPSSVVGAVAAAATASRLLGLSPAETADALGHGANASMGLVEAAEFMDPPHALLARNGLMAALMARAGMRMARTMMEGEHGLFRSVFGGVPDAIEHELSSLGHRFEIMAASAKRYRASGLNIVPMELAMDLVRVHRLDRRPLARVEVILPVERQQREAVWEHAVARPGADSTGRAGSLRFQIAVILADGAINPIRYETAPDQRLAQILSKVELTFEAERSIGYARLEVTTGDDDQYAAEGDLGYQPEPDWAAWLGSSHQRTLSDDRVAHLVDLIARLEDVDDVGEVLRGVTPTDS